MGRAGAALRGRLHGLGQTRLAASRPDSRGRGRISSASKWLLFGLGNISKSRMATQSVSPHTTAAKTNSRATARKASGADAERPLPRCGWRGTPRGPAPPRAASASRGQDPPAGPWALTATPRSEKMEMDSPQQRHVQDDTHDTALSQKPNYLRSGMRPENVKARLGTDSGLSEKPMCSR